MASLTPSELDLLGELAIKVFISHYMIIVGITWYLYDYILTFPREVAVIWRSKLNVTTILFILNRYCYLVSMLVNSIDVLVRVEDIANCRLLLALNGIMNLLTIFLIILIFTLRTYAICNRNRLILLLLLTVALVLIGITVNMAVSSTQHAIVLSLPPINNMATCETTSGSKLVSIGDSLAIAFDTLVFILTLSRTWFLSRQAKALGIKASLSILLLRDGSLYFGFFSVVAMVTAVVRSGVEAPLFLTNLVDLAPVLQVILVNRLILNLRNHGTHVDSQARTTQPDSFFRAAYLSSRNLSDRLDLGNDDQDGIDPKEGGQAQAPSFLDSVLGNIGEPLRVWGEDEDEDIEEIVDPADAELDDHVSATNGV